MVALSSDIARGGGGGVHVKFSRVFNEAVLS